MYIGVWQAPKPFPTQKFINHQSLPYHRPPLPKSIPNLSPNQHRRSLITFINTSTTRTIPLILNPLRKKAYPATHPLRTINPRRNNSPPINKYFQHGIIEECVYLEGFFNLDVVFVQIGEERVWCGFVAVVYVRACAWI